METTTSTSTAAPPSIQPLILKLRSREEKRDMQAEHASIADKARNVVKGFKEWLSSDLTRTTKSVIEEASNSSGPDGLSQEEADKINSRLMDEWENAWRPLRDHFFETVKVQPGDSKATAEFKQEIVAGVLSWLHDAFTWVIGELKKIFNFIKEGLKRAWESAKKLFAKLADMLSALVQ